MMPIIDPHQLSLVTENVRAGIVPMDGTNQDHVRLFKKYGAKFYQRLALVHGTAFSPENVERIMNAVANSDVELRFIYVAKELCDKVTKKPTVELMLAGIMTIVESYDVRWSKQGKRQIFPLEHGEDLILDETAARWFREATKTDDNPKGMGLGSFIIREQINQAANDPDFRGIAKDNEIGVENIAIQGAMRNNGAEIGTPEDSAVHVVIPAKLDLGGSLGCNIEIEY
jgi:hypothetical protein